MKILRYIELKSGYSGNGPAWIAYVQQSKSGRTLYFNGRGLMKLKGQRRGESGGNYIDMETGESFWVSGVKMNGQDRHWAGSGKVLIEAAAVPEYLAAIKSRILDTSRCLVTNLIRQTDIERLARLANSPGKGWPDDPAEQTPYSFVLSSAFFLGCERQQPRPLTHDDPASLDATYVSPVRSRVPHSGMRDKGWVGW